MKRNERQKAALEAKKAEEELKKQSSFEAKRQGRCSIAAAEAKARIAAEARRQEELQSRGSLYCREAGEKGTS